MEDLKEKVIEQIISNLKVRFDIDQWVHEDLLKEELFYGLKGIKLELED